jgi:hypothetical protein
MKVKMTSSRNQKEIPLEIKSMKHISHYLFEFISEFVFVFIPLKTTIIKNSIFKNGIVLFVLQHLSYRSYITIWKTCFEPGNL